MKVGHTVFFFSLLCVCWIHGRKTEALQFFKYLQMKGEMNSAWDSVHSQSIAVLISVEVAVLPVDI